MKRCFRWICVLVAALLCLGMTTDGLADVSEERAEQSSVGGVDERSIEESMEPDGEASFEEVFPHGKKSVVDRQVSGAAAVLRAAHKAALRGHEGRKDYREALVYQAASRRALKAERFALAMYLTLHARSLAEQVLYANTSERPPRDRSASLELIKRAGGVDSEEVDDYLDQASKYVPGAGLLFVDEEQ
ncbi:MAG: hypothetical protein ACOC9W_00520 [Persicimonas sp.]